jgi:hypothetical protein
MVGVRERAPAANGSKAGIAVFGEDHDGTLSAASAQRKLRPSFVSAASMCQAACSLTVGEK